MFYKSLYLAVPFAYECNHRNVGKVVPGHGAEQGAFADAASAKKADPLPLSAGEETVDGADSGYQWLVDMLAVQRTGRDRIKVVGALNVYRPFPIHGLAEPVEHPA